MLNDLRITFRQLSKSRGFALVAALTLAIGIGSVTTLYSVLRALVLEPFDYPESHELAQVWSGDYWPLSPADYLDLKEQMSSFETFGAYAPSSFNVGAENALAVSGVRATSGVLEAFGIQALEGRLLNAADSKEGAEPVAVISHGLWQDYFGGQENLVGSSIRLNGGNVTVVGIMPADFEFAGPWVRTEDLGVWLPMSLEEDKDKRDSHWLCGIARLKSGTDIESADAEIKTIGKRLSELYPNSNYSKKFLVRSLKFEMTRDMGKQVWLLFAAVGLVMLVACSNVASMLLARGAKRQGEIGVRIALGANRASVLRLALAESLVLAVLGAVLGLLLSLGGMEFLKAISPASEARKAAMGLDAAVLLFAVGVTLLTALLSGLPPVLAALRTPISVILRNDVRGSVGSRSRNYMLRGLVIGQVALAFILANGAGLFSASYLELLEENKVLSNDATLSLRLNLQGERYDENSDRVLFWENLVERVETIPGVTAAGVTSKLPLEGGSNTNGLVNDEVYDPSQSRIQIERTSVTPAYFEAMGLTLLQGRNLGGQDAMTDDGIMGVLVNQKMVERAWPDKNPLGEVIRANQASDPWYTATVVGVVENVRQWSATAEIQPEMYTTPKGHWGRRVYLVVRSELKERSLVPLLAEAVQGLDSELALEDIRSMRQVVEDSTSSQRAVASLVNLFMVIALGLVAVGLYGTLSYSLQQRTREIGVRRALGASDGEVSRLVYRQGATWVGLGIVVGLGGLFALLKLLQSLVYGMEGLDFTSMAIALAVLGASGFLACWLPSRRASRLDPLEALRM